MVRKERSLLCPLFLAITLSLLLLTIPYLRRPFARLVRLSVLPVPLQTPTKPRQLLTDYNGLIFRSGFQGSLYSFDLAGEQLNRIASSTGSWLSVSPDGHTIAFDFEGDLYLASATGEGLRKIVDSGGEGEIGLPSWSPDGLLLAYELVISSPTKDSALYIVDLNRLDAKRVSPRDLFVRRNLVPVSWSPDSHRVLFRACIDLPGIKRNSLGMSADVAHYDLYQVDINGDNLENITDGLGNLMDFHPSPDGQIIIFTSHLENQMATKEAGQRIYDAKVYFITVETGEIVEAMHMLMEDQGPPLGWYTPPWSLDSTWALMPTRWPDTWRAVRPDGTLHHEIIKVAGFVQGDVGLGWLISGLSPDGKTIAGRGRFKEGGNECLCAVDASGKNFRVLMPDIYVDSFVWSPDGKSIFFKYTLEEHSSSYRYGIVNADGSGFYDPFVNLPEKPVHLDSVHWVRLPPQVSTPTAAPSPTLTASPVSTLTPTVSLSPTVTPSPTGTPTSTDTSTSAPSPTAISLAPKATATALPINTATPASTQSPGNVCTVSGAIVLVALLGWWALRKRE